MSAGKLGKWLLYGAASALCILIVLTLGVKIALDRAPQYQAQIKSWVHEQTGFYVRFSSVYPSLRWYGPELYFDRLELRSKDDSQTVALARGGSIALDVWSLIANARLLAGRIRLDAPQLQIVRLGPHRFSVGSALEFGDGGGDLSQSLDKLPHGRLVVRDATVTLLQWNAELPELRFAGVNFDLGHRGTRVDLQLDTVMPAQLQGELKLRLGASGVGGSSAFGGGLNWLAQVRASNVSLPGWHKMFPEYSNRIDAGTARIDLSAAGAGGDVLQSSVDFTVSQIRISRSLGAPLELREAGGIFDFSREKDRWSLSGRRVRAQAAAAAGRETRFSAHWRIAAGALAELDAQFDYLRLAALLPVVAVLPQRDVRDRISAMELSGEWFDTRVRFARDSADTPARWSVGARFLNAGFAPIGAAPGLQGISGSVRGDERSGQMQLSAAGSRVLWPDQWPGPIVLDQLQASIFWKRTPQGMLLASQNLLAANKDFSASTKFALLKFDADRSPEITLASVISDVDASAAPRYLPRGHIAPDAMTWLNRAFVAGRVPHADFVVQGPLRQFPFRDGSGLFLVRFPAQDMILDYREDWPRIENLSLEAEFRNQGLNVWIKHATAGKVEVQDGQGSFADFKTGELRIQANSHTDAAAAVAFLAASPLDALSEQAFSKVEASGPLDAKIDLFLPFKQFDLRRVLVSSRLAGVSIAYKGSKARVTQLHGDVLVDGAQVPSAQLRGFAFGGPLQVRARAPRNPADHATQLELRGVFSAEGLRGAFDLPEAVLGAGRADWRGTIRWSPAPARERWVRLSSNLSGIAINLPQPFHKASARPLPLVAHIEWPKSAGPVIRASLTALVSGIVELDSSGESMRWSRAALAFGADTPELSSSDRLVIGGHIEELDLSGWLRLGLRDDAVTPVSEALRSASLRVDTLKFYGLLFPDVSLHLSAAAQAWQVGVSGPNAQGSIEFGRGNGASSPWQLRFSHLKIAEAAPQPDAPAAQIAPADPKSVPSLHLQSDEIIWRDRLIGSLDADLSRVEDGVKLDQLKVHSSNFNLQAEGNWRGPDGGAGHLEGLLVSNDVQKTLAQFGYADVVQAKAGRLEFDLNWAGAPSAAAIETLGGHLKLEADKGQIVDLHPGAGRVLGLASIATLPRRLFLDFSDLTDKGLAFDTIRGDFELRHGDAYTTNLLLDGPAAEIGVVGRVGLAKHDFDQTAVVAGNFGNSLPLASTLAAGPVVGAAVLVFSQVFKQPLKGLARGYYRITGSWDNPVVERVKSDEAAASTRRESKQTQR